jgi:phosphoglycerate dehydrogenase-like enzyme
MKVLIDVPLTDSQLRRIRDAAGDAQVVQAASGDDLVRQVREAEVYFGTIGPELFAQAGRLCWIQALGAGMDEQLFPDLVSSEVILTSEKGQVGPHLAEQAFALLLALTRGVARSLREPTWSNKESIRAECWELTGLTMGIVGFGGTGRAVARCGAAFGLRLLAVDPEAVERPPEVESVWNMDGFERLLAESDIVVICAPLTAATRGLFDDRAFDRMKRSALLINVSRGAIMDEAALLRALHEGLIAGAGLDVTPVEPLPDDHPLWSTDRVVITPHVAGASPLRMDRAVDLFCRNLVAFRQGQPLESVIDKARGY